MGDLAALAEAQLQLSIPGGDPPGGDPTGRRCGGAVAGGRLGKPKSGDGGESPAVRGGRSAPVSILPDLLPAWGGASRKSMSGTAVTVWADEASRGVYGLLLRERGMPSFAPSAGRRSRSAVRNFG